MHIVIDAHNLLTDRRGIGRYVRELTPRLAALGAEITLAVRQWFPSRLHARFAAEFDGWEHFTLASSVPKSADLMFHPWNGTFFRTTLASVATIHDCVPFAYPAADVRKRRREQEPFERSARTAKRILTDSHFSAGELQRLLAVEPGRIDVVPLAADAFFTPGSDDLLPPPLRERPYVLMVGADDERKNVATLVRAWESAFPSRDVALVSVGRCSSAGVIALENISQEVLRSLYRHALLFAMPSYYEGFGLPPLEAMRSGAPVLVSRAASLPEVCGDAAHYVEDPMDVTQWSRALVALCGDAQRREAMRARGLVWAPRFTWERTAQETYAIFECVAGGNA
jgi:glycosyltransferase involved in cell wall biosynthesis